MVSIESDITKRTELKHFSWNDIAKFAEKDRWMIDYRKEGSGDWKYVKEGGDKYLLVSVNSVPYWGDAIGQIPFAVNCFTDYLKKFKDYNKAKQETIQRAKENGNGELLSRESDVGNSYDNAMVLRAINWASERYTITKEGNLLKTNYSPEELSKASNGIIIK